MNIKQNSKVVLQKLYEILNEESYCLDIKFKTLDIAKRTGISYKQLLLCLFYLEDKEYLSGNISYSTVANDNTELKLTITSAGIDLVEGQI